MAVKKNPNPVFFTIDPKILSVQFTWSLNKLYNKATKRFEFQGEYMSRISVENGGGVPKARSIRFEDDPGRADEIMKFNCQMLSFKWAYKARSFMEEFIGQRRSATGAAAKNIKMRQVGGNQFEVYEDGEATGPLGDKIYYHNWMIRRGIEGTKTVWNPPKRNRRWVGVRQKPMKSKYAGTDRGVRAYWRFKRVEPNSPVGRIIEWMRVRGIDNGIRLTKKGTRNKLDEKVAAFGIYRHLRNYGQVTPPTDYVAEFLAKYSSQVRSDLNKLGSYSGDNYVNVLVGYVGRKFKSSGRTWHHTTLWRSR